MTASTRCAAFAVLLMMLPIPTVAAQTFADVDRAALAGIREGLYPGAVVVIGRRDSILYSRGYGHFTWNPASRMPDPDSTLWDVASITKVVATAASAMRLVDQGKLDLDAPVRRFLPRFSGGTAKYCFPSISSALSRSLPLPGSAGTPARAQAVFDRIEQIAANLNG